MNNISKQTRNYKVDIGKGLAIIMMCIGHSYCPLVLHDFIYMYHMAFFFMMSGYFFSQKNLDSFYLFSKKRVTGLWLPFVKWGIIFVLLHNLFLEIHLLPPPINTYSLKDILWFGLTTIPRFIPTEDFMGPYWFLSALFYVNILSWLVFYISGRFRQSWVTPVLFILLYALGFIGLKIGNMNIPLVCSLLYYLGYVLKQNNSKIENNFCFFLLSCFILIAGLFSGRCHIEIPILKLENPVLFLLYSLSGCYFLLYISSMLERNKVLKGLFAYIGRNSLVILMANVLCIRIFSLLRSYFTSGYQGEPIYIFKYDNSWYWWILYTLFSVAVPLFCRELYIKIKSSIVRKSDGCPA